MNWLLVLLLFDTTNGALDQRMHTERLYKSEQACVQAGNELTINADYKQANLKGSFVCLPKSVFNEPKPAPKPRKMFGIFS